MNVNLLLADKLQFFTIQFNSSSKHYTYKAPNTIQLAVGDKVVVDSPSEGLVVVVITEMLTNVPTQGRYKFIVSKVDLTEYDRLTKLESSMISIIEKDEMEKQQKAFLALISTEAQDLLSQTKLLL